MRFHLEPAFENWAVKAFFLFFASATEDVSGPKHSCGFIFRPERRPSFSHTKQKRKSASFSNTDFLRRRRSLPGKQMSALAPATLFCAKLHKCCDEGRKIFRSMPADKEGGRGEKESGSIFSSFKHPPEGNLEQNSKRGICRKKLFFF